MGRVAILMSAGAVSNCVQHLFWIKSVGDHVEKDAALASVEAEKGLYFIRTPTAGVLEERTIPHGSIVHSGDVLGWLVED